MQFKALSAVGILALAQSVMAVTFSNVTSSAAPSTGSSPLTTATITVTKCDTAGKCAETVTVTTCPITELPTGPITTNSDGSTIPPATTTVPGSQLTTATVTVTSCHDNGCNKIVTVTTCPVSELSILTGVTLSPTKSILTGVTHNTESFITGVPSPKWSTSTVTVTHCEDNKCSESVSVTTIPVPVTPVPVTPVPGSQTTTATVTITSCHEHGCNEIVTVTTCPVSELTKSILTGATLSTKSILTGVTQSTQSFITGVPNPSASTATVTKCDNGKCTESILTGVTHSTQSFITGVPNPSASTATVTKCDNGKCTETTVKPVVPTQSTITQVNGAPVNTFGGVLAGVAGLMIALF